MKKIVMTQKVNDAGLRLAKDINFVDANNPDPNNYLDEMQDADGLIVRIAKCDRNVILNSPKLKVIGRTGVGYDSVDVKTATEHGIPVVITPGANSLSVAEHTLAFILSLSKNLVHQDKECRNGNWEVRGSGDYFEVNGKTVGIIGLGAIGKYLSNMCQSLGMKVIWYDPFINDSLSEYGDKYDDYKELLKNSDFVSIHVPLTEDTENLITINELKLMKKDSFIINASRGGLINEDDLIYALDNDIIKGAALDVFVEEPIDMNNKLVQSDKVILTPHSAAQTKEAVERMAELCVKGCMAIINGEKWPYVADKSVYDHEKWDGNNWVEI